MDKCTICPRNCSVDRRLEFGVCSSSDNIKISKVMLHHWEEPFISGDYGSGAIFFSGCNLKCVFCQNHEISNDAVGYEVSVETLSEIMLYLQKIGAHNINLVTGAHFALKIIEALKLAKKKGLSIPIVYNSSGYEKVETIKLFSGLIDIYLPDFKYFDEQSALRYSKAKNYPSICKNSIEEMFRQVGPLKFEGDLLKKGMVVRHLMLPNHLYESKDILDYLHDKYKNDIFISIMNQYVPMHNASQYDEINRKVSKEEYQELVDFALMIGLKNALTQDNDSQDTSFTPDFKTDDIIKNFI